MTDNVTTCPSTSDWETSPTWDVYQAPSSGNPLHGIRGDIATWGVILGTLIIVVGAVGNVLVVVAIVTSKPLCKASNAFVGSLAMCDLFQTLLVRPLYVYTYAVRRWAFSPTVCIYALYASNLAILESIVHVSAIALYRYVIICHERLARKWAGRKAVGTLLVAIYVLPFILVLGPSLTRFSSLQVTFNTHIMFCSFQKQSDSRIAAIFKKVLFLSLAAIFLLYCYIRIYHVVRESGRNLDDVVRESARGLDHDVTGSWRIRAQLSPARVRREITLLKTVLVVFCTFVASYLPLSLIYGIDRGRHLPSELYFVSVLLLWMSSSVNWMIYGLMNRRFLLAYRHLLCGWRMRDNRFYQTYSVPRTSRLAS